MMTTALRHLRAVLWSFAGMGGRRTDATDRLEKANPLALVVIAFALVALIVVGLVALAHFAAGG